MVCAVIGSACDCKIFRLDVSKKLRHLDIEADAISRVWRNLAILAMPVEFFDKLSRCLVAYLHVVEVERVSGCNQIDEGLAVISVNGK